MSPSLPCPLAGEIDVMGICKLEVEARKDQRRLGSANQLLPNVNLETIELIPSGVGRLHGTLLELGVSSRYLYSSDSSLRDVATRCPTPVGHELGNLKICRRSRAHEGPRRRTHLDNMCAGAQRCGARSRIMESS